MATGYTAEGRVLNGRLQLIRSYTPLPFEASKGEVRAGILRFALLNDTIYWVQGSALPKEVRNPRWVPH